jgi:hypothetical protein
LKKVAVREAPAEAIGQILRESPDQFFPVFSSPRTFLFVLDYTPSNLPIRGRDDVIDRSSGSPPRCIQQRSEIRQQFPIGRILDLGTSTFLR